MDDTNFFLTEMITMPIGFRMFTIAQWATKNPLDGSIIAYIPIP